MWYDCLAVAILAYTTIRGAMKGVIWQIAAIAGLVCCFVFSESISAAAGPYVKLEPPLNNWVVMIGSYLLFSLAAFSIAKLLTEWLDKIHFGDFNRHLGAIFGFVKGVILVLVLTFFLVTVSERMHEVLEHSRTGPIAALIMYKLHPIMPESLHDKLARYIDIHKLDDDELREKYQRDGLDNHDHGIASGTSGTTGDLILPDGVHPDDVQAVLSRVPKDMRGEFENLLMRSLDKSSAGDRDDLLKSLIDAFKKAEKSNDLTSLLQQLLQQPPEQLVATATSWLGSGGTAAFSTDDPFATPDAQTPPPAAAGTPSRRNELIASICTEFSRFPLAQQRIRQDIEQQLTGVPDAVAVSALEDWQADLINARPGQDPAAVRDPDPSTKAATALRQRIERQTARGISSPAATEERLQ